MLKSTKFFIASLFLCLIGWMWLFKTHVWSIWTLLLSWSAVLFYLGFMNAICRESLEASKKVGKQKADTDKDMELET